MFVRGFLHANLHSFNLTARADIGVGFHGGALLDGDLVGSNSGERSEFGDEPRIIQAIA